MTQTEVKDTVRRLQSITARDILPSTRITVVVAAVAVVGILCCTEVDRHVYVPRGLNV